MNEFIGQLEQIDKAIFMFINMTLSNQVTDFIMPIITADNLLRIGYLSVLILILIKGSKNLRWAALFSLLVILLTDQIAAGLLKPLIERARPCHIFMIDEINLLVNCGGGKSMPSAHASNAFGQAMFFILINKRLKYYLLIFAFLVSISRVFVGVHFPADVFVGAAIGALFGWAIYHLYQFFLKKVEQINAPKN